MRPLALISVLAIACGLGWFLMRSDAPAAPPIEENRSVVREETPAPTADADLAATTSPRADRTQATSTSKIAPRATSTTSIEDHPWKGSLAGLVGRLVESDGTPVPGLQVELYSVDIGTLIAAGHQPVSEELCAGRGRSDEDGRFSISGARGSSFHGLGIDPGGGRFTLRVVESTLHYGTVTDVGDIVLQPGGVVTGTVVDEDGEPVEGARVRFAAVPEVVVQSGALDLRQDSLIAFGQLGGSANSESEKLTIIDPRSELRMVANRLPVATGTTDAQGAFRLEGVPGGRLVGGADAAGFVAGTVDGFQLDAGSEVDVGEIELLLGRTVIGRVVDAAEAPIEGAEVRVGALNPLAPLALLQPGTTTDAGGRFELEGVPEEGSVVGIARRSPADDWVSAQAVGMSENLTIKMPRAAALYIELVDEAGGRVSGGRISLRSTTDPNEQDRSAFAISNDLDFFSEQGPRSVRAEEVESGVYLVEELALGWYQVQAEAEGFGVTHSVHGHLDDAPALRMVCGAAWQLGLRFVDEVSGEPVEHVHAVLVENYGKGSRAVASTWSDADGNASLGPLGSSPLQTSAFNSSPFEEPTVLFQHPGYPKDIRPLSTLKREAGDVNEIRLTPPGSISGRVTWAGKAPGAEYMLILERRDQLYDREFELPSLTRTSPEGAFRFEGVAPGTYRVTFIERFLDRDPLSFLTEAEEPETAGIVEVVVVKAEEATVTLDLLADGSVAPGWFEGRVRVAGQVPTNTYCRIGWSDDKLYPLDGNGEFRTEEMDSTDQVQVAIVQFPEEEQQTGDDPDSKRSRGPERVLYSAYRAPTAGGARIDLDLELRAINLTVLDDVTLEPVAGARVSLTDSGGGRASSCETDEQGRAMFELPLGEGHVSIQIKEAGYALYQESVDRTSGEPIDVECHLTQSVPCAGTVVLPATAQSNPGNEQGVWLLIGDAGEPNFQGNWIQVSEELAFEAEGCSPGQKQARLWTGGEMKSLPFELPEGGSTSIELDFSNL